MNVQGALVERALGRSIMSRFHAGWSIGTVAGALLGAAVVALRVPVSAAPVRRRGGRRRRRALRGARLPRRRPRRLAGGRTTEPRRAPSAAWREPRTLLIGVFVLAFAFAEGTGNDWISVAVIDGYRVSPAVGTLGVRPLPRRDDRRPLVRARPARPLRARPGGAADRGAGAVRRSARLRLRRPTPARLAGALLWGLGTSLGFPVGMSAGADDAGPRPRPGQRHRLHRLRRLPRGPPAHRLPRRPRRCAPRPAQRGRAARFGDRPRRGGRGQRK